MRDNKDINKEGSRTVESGNGNIEQAPKIGQLQYAFAPSSSFISRHPYPHPYSTNLKKRSDMIELQRKGILGMIQASDIRKANPNKMQYKSSKKQTGYSNMGSKRVSTASSIIPNKTPIQAHSQKPIHTHNFDSNCNTAQSPSITITMPLRSQEQNIQCQNQIKVKNQIALTAKSIDIKEKYVGRDRRNAKTANGEEKQKGKQKGKHRQMRELKGKKEQLNPEIENIRTQPCQTNSPNKYQSTIENMEIQVKIPQSQIESNQISISQIFLKTCPNFSQQIPSRRLNPTQTKRVIPKRIYSAVPTVMTAGTTGTIAKIKNPYKTSTVNFSQHFTLLEASHKQHKEYKKQQMNCRQEMNKMGPFPYCKKLTISNVNKYYQLCIEEIKNNSKQLKSKLQSKIVSNCYHNQQISQERQKDSIMIQQLNNENELNNKNLNNLNQQILFEQCHHNIKNSASPMKKQCLQRNKSAHSYNYQVNSMGRNNTYSYSTATGKDSNTGGYSNNGRNGRKSTIAKQDKNNVASIHSQYSQSQSQYRNGYGNWNQIANPWFQVKNITTQKLAHGILLQPQSSQVNPIYLSQLQQFYALCTKKQIVSRPVQLSYKKNILNSCINNTAQLMQKNLSLSMLNRIKNYQKQMMDGKDGKNEMGICYRYGGQSRGNEGRGEKEKKNQDGERELLVGWDFGDKEGEEVEQIMKQGFNNQSSNFQN